MEMNGTIIINQPIETVFAYVVDVSNDVHWRAGNPESRLKSGHTLGPGAVGYTQVGDVEAEWHVTSYNLGESVEWELVSGPFLGRGGYRLVPVEDGTEFTLISDVKPTGLYRLLGPLFGWMGRRQNQADVEKLRDILESTPH
jgi:hypothetical protein